MSEESPSSKAGAWRLLLTTTYASLRQSVGLVEVSPNLVDLTRSPEFDAAGWYPHHPRMPAPRPKQVELRFPSGTRSRVACVFAEAHLNYGTSNKPTQELPPWVFVCCLVGVTVEEVQPGTEVWYESAEE
jgi:hypothetical protein